MFRRYIILPPNQINIYCYWIIEAFLAGYLCFVSYKKGKRWYKPIFLAFIYITQLNSGNFPIVCIATWVKLFGINTSDFFFLITPFCFTRDKYRTFFTLKKLNCSLSEFRESCYNFLCSFYSLFFFFSPKKFIFYTLMLLCQNVS